MDEVLQIFSRSLIHLGGLFFLAAIGYYMERFDLAWRVSISLKKLDLQVLKR